MSTFSGLHPISIFNISTTSYRRYSLQQCLLWPRQWWNLSWQCWMHRNWVLSPQLLKSWNWSPQLPTQWRCWSQVYGYVVVVITHSKLCKKHFHFFCCFDWFYVVPTNCTDGQIRLRGGSNYREGRVEICFNRIWGTVCDTYWDDREAQVACRQLGFPSIGKFIPYLLKQNTCKLTLLSGHVLSRFPNKFQELD